MKNYITLLTLLVSFFSYAQNLSEPKKATLTSEAVYMVEVPSIASRDYLEPAEPHYGAPVRKGGANKAIPGKGYPKNGDPLATAQKNATKINGREPLQTFNAESMGNPNDPTGAAGPNHYVTAYNSGFRIWDKEGNPLTEPASLVNIFPGEYLGDPCVVYDRYAERFVIVQFSDSPNGFLVAVCQGEDPVNDGWYTYRFNTGSFPDYEKISVWSDGYYVTANKNSSTAGTSEVVYALERDKMIVGDPDAQMVGFPLTGITTSGFYSPAGFNCNGAELPPPGNAPIVYMQDDAWSGVTTDHLKLWNVNVDWDNTSNSEISSPQIINTTPFDGLFDNGSFINLPQPTGNDIDALQATIMYMAQYRRFEEYNSAVFNFVVDLDGDDDYAGIRWYELRQNNDGAPWFIHQEGTYVQPDGHSAFCGGIAMDKYGNIGLGYTVVSQTQAPSIRYTGRNFSDPLSQMTLAEEVIINSNSSNPGTRYGDYAQMTVDPVDDHTFWHIAEYFVGSTRTSRVGVFQIDPEIDFDAGVVAVNSPVSSTLGVEQITVTIRNFGLNSISNFPISYQVNGGALQTETYNGTIPANSEVQYTFSATSNMSTTNATYSINAYTSLANDEFNDNNGVTVEVVNLPANNVGVTAITNPSSGANLTSFESVIVSITNFGGVPQSNFPVAYAINGGVPVVENFTGVVQPLETVEMTFSTTGNFSAFGDYLLSAYTILDGDVETSNDGLTELINNVVCSEALFSILTDCFEQETSWRLETAEGLLIQEVAGGSLGDSEQNDYEFCLEPDCYKLIIEDTFGDGLAGATQFSCPADGDYSFNLNGTTIIQMADPDFDFIIEHDFCVEGPVGAVVNLKAMLEGAFNSNTNLMNDYLRDNGDLPVEEPYTQFGYEDLTNAGESTIQSLLNVTGNNAIVDWVVVELRSGTDAANVLSSQVALIQRDGDVVGLDGSSSLSFTGVAEQQVYVSIRHRNHFGVRTGDAVLSSDLIDIDFTDPNLEIFGNNAAKNIDGIRVLIAGDANGDGVINSIDKTVHWRIENSSNASYDYHNVKADMNLDGVVNSIDLNFFWRINNGTGQQLD